MKLIASHINALLTVLCALGLGACSGPDALPDACTIPLTKSVTNGCVVTPGTLWRGGKPDAAGAQALVNLGVKTVVNLELLHDDVTAFESARPNSAQSSTVSYFRVRDWEPNVVIATSVLDEHVAEFIAITKNQAKPIYVHCRSGQNRTGVMVAAYRVLVENAAIETAVAEMGKYQGVWFKQDAAYIHTLKGSHRLAIERMVRQQPRPQPEVKLVCTAAGCTQRNS
jgi:protein tyrosine phosphatase (PTP) superfamily phosphohydrolase (DUF442 family)